MGQNHGGWIVRFGVFEINLRTGELRKQGIRIKLQEQPFQVLAMLLEKPGEIVTREEMRERLWPKDTFVDFDHSLNKAINKIRDALCDSAENPRFVETLARRGYRFLAPVQYQDPTAETASSLDLASKEVSKEEEPVRESGASPIQPKRQISAALFSRRWLLVLSLAIIGLCLIYLFRPSVRIPTIKKITQLSHDGWRDKVEIVLGSSSLFVLEFRNETYQVCEIPLNGGETKVLPLVFPERPQDLFLLDFSAKKGSLLIKSSPRKGGEESADSSCWLVRIPSLEMSRFNTLQVGRAKWSPNQEFLAYTVDRDIFLADAEGGNSRKLQTMPNPVTWLSWFPDGRGLRVASVSPGGRTSAAWDLALEEGNPQIVPLRFQTGTGFGGGDWILQGACFIFWIQLDQPWEWYYADLWGRVEKSSWMQRNRAETFQLTTGPLNFHSAAADPGGGKFYAVGALHRGEMRRFDPKSKQWSPFLEGISADGLEYSRDGKWIIYVNYPEEQLWRAKADGSQKLQLTTSPNLICLPRWSPDGTQILLMYRHPPEPWKMGVIDRDGGELKPLISGEGTETDPNWSPDGTRIVYCSSDYQELSGLCIFDIQRNTVETVPGSQNLFSPRWSPDGRYIVAISSAKEYYGHLWLFDLEKKKWSPLTSMVSGFPLWSKDGKFVHYGDQLPFTGHFRVRIQDGKVERISELAGMKKIGNLGGWDGLTPEGDPLILHDTGHTEVYALEVEP